VLNCERKRGLETYSRIGNLDPVTFIRKEEHAQFGKVLAVHFHSRSETPLYVGNHHYEELRSLLALSNGQAQRAS
jgi:hypothetical protein